MEKTPSQMTPEKMKIKSMTPLEQINAKYANCLPEDYFLPDYFQPG